MAEPNAAGPMGQLRAGKENSMTRPVDFLRAVSARFKWVFLSTFAPSYSLADAESGLPFNLR